MKIPQVFCLVVLLFISVEVLGQRQKGSRNSGNNGIGNGPNQGNRNWLYFTFQNLNYTVMVHKATSGKRLIKKIRSADDGPTDP